MPWAKKGNIPFTPDSILREFFSSFLDGFLPLMTPVIILGGILGGIFSPTEAAIVASTYALILGVFIYRELKWKDLFAIIIETDQDNEHGRLHYLRGGDFRFSSIGREQVPQSVAKLLFTISQDPKMIMFIIIVFLLIIGCFMETTAALILLTPILVPPVMQMGIDPVHFRPRHGAHPDDRAHNASGRRSSLHHGQHREDILRVVYEGYGPFYHSSRSRPLSLGIYSSHRHVFTESPHQVTFLLLRTGPRTDAVRIFFLTVAGNRLKMKNLGRAFFNYFWRVVWRRKGGWELLWRQDSLPSRQLSSSIGGVIRQETGHRANQANRRPHSARIDCLPAKALLVPRPRGSYPQRGHCRRLQPGYIRFRERCSSSPNNARFGKSPSLFDRRPSFCVRRLFRNEHRRPGERPLRRSRGTGC